MKKAFTMTELVFVIVVIGILSTIALPKFSKTMEYAYESKAKGTVEAARAALSNLRQKRVLRGNFDSISVSDVGENFSHLVQNGVKSCETSGCGGWSTDGNTFTFHSPNGDLNCTLSNNKLNCDSGLEY